MSAANSSAVLHHVPSELLEEILLKLPIKSLLRFTTVSKSWLSIISGSRFVQEQKRRAAVNGVKKMVTGSSHNHLNSSTSVLRIPHTSSMGNDDSTPLIYPIEGGQGRLLASCDGLWLVEAEHPPRLFTWVYPPSGSGATEKSLYLWNPSTRAHRQLPDPLLLTGIPFAYGLGYDSAADDYNVLKIARNKSSSSIPTELYSLKSDSWKTISPPPGVEQLERCEYLNGSFHWIRTLSNTIVTFDLSTEKCGEIKFPAIALDSYWNYVEVVVVRGKLCVTVNNFNFFSNKGFCFALWVMEEYGVEKSWTKELNIKYGFARAFGPLPCAKPCANLKPVHFYDNGDILFNVNASLVELCMYKNEGARFERVVARDGTTMRGGFIYVESLVSPLPG